LLSCFYFLGQYHTVNKVVNVCPSLGKDVVGLKLHNS
jgi:hypothetical protein